MARLTPQDFGGTADDGSAGEEVALNALFAAVSNTYDVAYIDGIWRFNAQLLLPDRISIEGPGQLLSSVDGGAAIRAYSTTPATTYSELSIDNLDIRQLQFANTIGLQIERGNKLRLNRVRFTNWIGAGNTPLAFYGCQTGLFTDLDINGFGSYGIIVDGLAGYTSSTDLQFYGCRVLDGRGVGFAGLYGPAFTAQLSGCIGLTWEGGSFENISGPSVEIDMPRRCRFKWTRFEGIDDGYSYVKWTNSGADALTLSNELDGCSFDNNDLVTPLVSFDDLYNTTIRENAFPASSIALGDTSSQTLVFHNSNVADYGYI